jgi:hypothetical protein
MGAWGAGTFDADAARDFLADQVGRWEKLIDKLIAGKVPREVAAFEFDPGLDAAEACAMPLVELLIVTAERLDPDHFPSAEKVDRWRAAYLALFDREAGGPDADAEYVAERRRVIGDTFTRLRELAASRAEG